MGKAIRIAIVSDEWYPVFEIVTGDEAVDEIEKEGGWTITTVSQRWLDRYDEIFDKFVKLQDELKAMDQLEDDSP